MVGLAQKLPFPVVALGGAIVGVFALLKLKRLVGGGDFADAAGAGWSVAMSSDAATVVVGASSRGGEGADDTAIVYDWSDNHGWYFKVGEPLPGAAVAISGDGTYVAVGSADDDSADRTHW